MDDHNNAIGIGIAGTYPNATDEQLRDKVQQAINSGQGLRYVTANNPMVQTNTNASGRCDL